MQVLLATTNANKVSRLGKLMPDIDLLTLNDVQVNGEPVETLSSGAAIASEKALFYLDKTDLKYPVLTQDDTLYFQGVDDADQPGVSIKDPVKRALGSFTDENAVQYYAGLAKKYGGSIDIEFRYGHSLAFNHVWESGRQGLVVLSAKSALKGRLVPETKNLKDFPGYFLAAMMRCKVGGTEKYYSEMTDRELVEIDGDLKKSLFELIEAYRKMTKTE